MRHKSMSLRRAIKRRNILVVDNLATGGLDLVPVTHKFKQSQRYKYSNQAKKPSKIAYTIEELHQKTVSKFTHRFKDGQQVDFLSSAMLLGPLAPIVKPKELSL